MRAAGEKVGSKGKRSSGTSKGRCKRLHLKFPLSLRRPECSLTPCYLFCPLFTTVSCWYFCLLLRLAHSHLSVLRSLLVCFCVCGSVSVALTRCSFLHPHCRSMTMAVAHTSFVPSKGGIPCSHSGACSFRVERRTQFITSFLQLSARVEVQVGTTHRVSQPGSPVECAPAGPRVLSELYANNDQNWCGRPSHSRCAPRHYLPFDLLRGVCNCSFIMFGGRDDIESALPIWQLRIQDGISEYAESELEDRSSEVASPVSRVFTVSSTESGHVAVLFSVVSPSPFSRLTRCICHCLSPMFGSP